MEVALNDTQVNQGYLDPDLRIGCPTKAPNPLKTADGRNTLQLLCNLHEQMRAESFAALAHFDQQLNQSSSFKRMILALSRPKEFSGWVEQKELEQGARNFPDLPIEKMSAALEQLERVGLVSSLPILATSSIYSAVTVSGYRYSPTSLGMALLPMAQQPETLPARF